MCTRSRQSKRDIRPDLELATDVHIPDSTYARSQLQFSEVDVAGRAHSCSFGGNIYRSLAGSEAEHAGRLAAIGHL